jgi:hypothetical protein
MRFRLFIQLFWLHLSLKVLLFLRVFTQKQRPRTAPSPWVELSLKICCAHQSLGFIAVRSHVALAYVGPYFWRFIRAFRPGFIAAFGL